MDADYQDAVEKGCVWIAERDDAVAGLLVLVPSDGYLLLENVAVDPDAQGHGIGRLLLKHAEDQALSRELCEIRLYTNEVMVENQRLYKGLGYVEVDRRCEDGLSRVYYVKRL